jgi:hypothetical protein
LLVFAFEGGEGALWQARAPNAHYSPKVCLRDVPAGDKAGAVALLEREGLELVSGTGERLSDLSMLICECDPCFSGFGIEPDEKFVSESNAYDYFGFALVNESLAEGCEALIFSSAECCFLAIRRMSLTICSVDITGVSDFCLVL